MSHIPYRHLYKRVQLQYYAGKKKVQEKIRKEEEVVCLLPDILIAAICANC